MKKINKWGCISIKKFEEWREKSINVLYINWNVKNLSEGRISDKREQNPD